MKFPDVVSRLVNGLRGGPLPGASAQALLAPRPRREWPVGFNPARIRLAAGLLLVFPMESREFARQATTESVESIGDAHIVLTVRADHVRHGGQVSLPGGAVDPGETLERAALREAHEEVGLVTDQVRTLGALTPLDIPVSGFRLHPIVAASPQRPVLAPSDGEVARILEVNLEELLKVDRLTERERIRDGHTLLVPAFHVHGVEIWGATAMILAEFLVLLGWNPVRD